MMLAACWRLGTRVTSGPGLILRVMSGSIVLPQLGSVLIFMTHVATNARGVPGVWASTYGHFAVQGLCYLWDRANLSGLCWSPGELMTSRPELLLGIMSRSVIQLLLGSVLVFKVRDNTKGHTDAWGLDNHMRPCCQGHTDLVACAAFSVIVMYRTEMATGYVGVHSPAAAVVCVDVHGPCYHRGHRNRAW